MNIQVNNKLKGIGLMILASMAFSLMQIAIAKTAANIPLYEQLFFRNLIAAIVAYVSLRRHKENPFGAKENRGLLVLRSVTGYVGMVTLFYATANANQGDVAIINKMSPFVVTVLAFIFLKEKITRYQIIGLFTAFTGAFFVSNPQFNSNVYPIFVAFLSAIFAGMAYTVVGKLKGRESPRVIVFFFSAFTTVLTLIMGGRSFVVPSVVDFIGLLLIGIFASIGQLAMTYAYAMAKASEVSIYNYSGIIFSMLFGYIFLGQSIKSTSAIGAAFVIAAGVIVFLGNRRLELAQRSVA